MICTSVIPCLSIGLAKNNKILSYFPSFFGHFVRLAFPENWGGGGGGGGDTQTLHQKQSNRMFQVNFSKGTAISNNFQKCMAF